MPPFLPSLPPSICSVLLPDVRGEAARPFSAMKSETAVLWVFGMQRENVVVPICRQTPAGLISRSLASAAERVLLSASAVSADAATVPRSVACGSGDLRLALSALRTLRVHVRQLLQGLCPAAAARLCAKIDSTHVHQFANPRKKPSQEDDGLLKLTTECHRRWSF